MDGKTDSDRWSKIQSVNFDSLTISMSGKDILTFLNECSINKHTFDEININFSKLVAALNDRKPKEETMSSRSLIILEHLFCVLRFIFQNDNYYLNDYKVVVTKHVEKNEPIFTLNFWCMFPRVAFDYIRKNAHSIILTSGTLSPMNSFASELQTTFSESFEGTHVIDMKKQVQIHNISTGPNNVKMNGIFKESQTPEYQNSLGELIYKYCQGIEYGILCFFPSYTLMEKCLERWKEGEIFKKIQSVKEVFVEPRQTEKGEKFLNMIKNYYKTITDYEEKKSKQNQTGSIFFAVCRGKVSEGIDFSDNRARAVLMVGIPFPNFFDLQIDLKKKFNDESKSLGLLPSGVWYSQQGYRALNQAIGRCIRHKDDYGAIILIDERFGSKTHQEGISKWLRNDIQKLTYTGSLNVLKVFFQKLKNKSRVITFSQVETSLTQNYQSFQHGDLTQGIAPECSIECKGCSNLNNFENITELQLIDKPFLFNIFNKIKESKELFVLQIKNTFNLSGKFSSYLPESLTPIEKITKEYDFKTFNISIQTPVLTPGKPFHTGIIDSDGVSYELIFCMKCKIFIGVKIVAANLENMKYIGDYWIFRDLVNYKLKPSFSQDTDESPVEKKRKYEVILD